MQSADPRGYVVCSSETEAKFPSTPDRQTRLDSAASSRKKKNKPTAARVNAMPQKTHFAWTKKDDNV